MKSNRRTLVQIGSVKNAIPTLLCLLLIVLIAPPTYAQTAITAIWANDGGDKVSQDELRVSRHVENRTGLTRNRTWDGSTIHLFGAHNEVVSFNLILEAGGSVAADSVSVSFNELRGPSGTSIHSSAAKGNGVFNWVGRPIELFYTRYLQLKGLSYFGYNKWDERQIPVRFQRPHLDGGEGYGSWYDRPDHDKFYPDPLVPLELVPKFSIDAGKNQSIWADIYVPKNVPAGVYNGVVSVTESDQVTHQIPVQLSIYGFSLPDEPSAKSMGIMSSSAILYHHVTGGQYFTWNSAEGRRAQAITDRYFQLFHRHKISLLGENECPIADHPCDSSIPRLDGSLYTANHDYDGPGVGTQPGIFSIGTYGTWSWRDQGRAEMWQHTDNWATWFQQYLPGTQTFLYLQDEPKDHDWSKNEQWAKWMADNPGPGKAIPSLITMSPVTAKAAVPSLAIPMTGMMSGMCPPGVLICDTSATTAAAAHYYQSTPGRDLWGYNDGRPAAGSAMLEDDGVAMRTIPWAQSRSNIRWWMYWYVNPDTSIDLFHDPVTFGTVQYFDYANGWVGNDGCSNGNGQLVLYGTDLFNPQSSYGVDGPIGTVRLKEWRRGIQDADYLALAKQIDPVATKAIEDRMMPLVMWQYGGPGSDPNYYTGQGPTWSDDPDNWESARTELASIIAQGCMSKGSASNASADAPSYSACSPSNIDHNVGSSDDVTLLPLTITSSTPGANFVIFGPGCSSGVYGMPSTIRVKDAALCMIQVSAPDGFRFSGWADMVATTPRPVVMSSSAQTLVARFAVADSSMVAVTITSTIANTSIVMGGPNCPVGGSHSTPYTFAAVPGNPCVVTANTPSGYRFVQWSNGVAANSMVFNIPGQATTYNATIVPVVQAVPNVPSLTINSNIPGVSYFVFGAGCSTGIVTSPITLSVAANSVCSIRPIVPDGVTFQGWSDGISNSPRAVYIEKQPVEILGNFQ